jgi:hypothetical protein
MTLPDEPRDSSAGEPSGVERRQSVRYDCTLDAARFMTAIVEGDVHPARVRNISTGGISLIVSRKYEPGMPLFVQILASTHQLARVLEVKVIYAVEHPSGDWILGGAFVEKLSGDELKLLLNLD